MYLPDSFDHQSEGAEGRKTWRSSCLERGALGYISRGRQDPHTKPAAQGPFAVYYMIRGVFSEPIPRRSSFSAKSPAVMIFSSSVCVEYISQETSPAYMFSSLPSFSAISACHFALIQTQYKPKSKLDIETSKHRIQCPLQTSKQTLYASSKCSKQGGSPSSPLRWATRS